MNGDLSEDLFKLFTRVGESASLLLPGGSSGNIGKFRRYPKIRGGH